MDVFNESFNTFCFGGELEWSDRSVLQRSARSLLVWTDCTCGVCGAAAQGDGGAAVFGVGKMVVDWCYLLWVRKMVVLYCGIAKA